MTETGKCGKSQSTLNTFILPDAIIRGDVWLQLVSVTQLARDFTGTICTPSVWQGEVEVEGLIPSAVVTIPRLGQVDVLLRLTKVQTQEMASGGYSVRARVEIPDSWGPYTVAAINFDLVL